MGMNCEHAKIKTIKQLILAEFSSDLWYTTEEVHTESYKFPANRGDLIEVNRGTYSHWVICEDLEEEFGQGDYTYNCFHVTDIIGKYVSIGQIRKEKLSDILANSGCKTPSKCRINNQKSNVQYWISKKGDLHKYPYLDRVFKDLNRMIGNQVIYDFKTMNCEHYCTLWKYGISWSNR